MNDGFLPAYYHSIFFQLFRYASDDDSKLILLDQVLELGDQKEIALLEELECMESLEVSSRAYWVKTKLLALIEAGARTSDKLPMSLCFLYEEFDIHPPKIDSEPELDFELSLELLINE